MTQEIEYSAYRIQLEAFSGPMDLLLYLIRREEVEIWEIPISRITEEYLNYIEVMEAIDLSLAGDFLVMAATLMEIKSRMLLPPEEQVADEDEDEEDPRSELIQRLMEYKRFKDAARFLHSSGEPREFMFTRPEEVIKIPQEWLEEELLKKDPLEGVTLWDLLNAFTRILRRTKPIVQAKVTYEEIPLRVFFHRLMDQMRAKPTCAFEELFTDGLDRSTIIGMFLALLELVRLKKMRVMQSEPFGQIWVEWVTGASLSDDEVEEAAALFEQKPEDRPHYEGAFDLAGQGSVSPADSPASESDRDAPAETDDVDIETLRSRHLPPAPGEPIDESITPLPGFVSASTPFPGPAASAGEVASSPRFPQEEDVEEYGEEDEIDKALAEVIIPEVGREMDRASTTGENGGDGHGGPSSDPSAKVES